MSQQLVQAVKADCDGTNIQRQSVLSTGHERFPLEFYCEIEHERGYENYNGGYTRNERKRTTRLRAESLENERDQERI
jgi:hypothetical protein